MSTERKKAIYHGGKVAEMMCQVICNQYNDTNTDIGEKSPLKIHES